MEYKDLLSVDKSIKKCGKCLEKYKYKKQKKIIKKN